MADISKIKIPNDNATYNLKDSAEEKTANKVTSITGSNTDTQYPSAKAVYALFTSITNGR